MKIKLKLPDNTTREFTFRMDFNGLAEYEEMFNRSAADIKGMGISTARNLAYIGFKEGDDTFDLTLQQVGQCMNPELMTEIFEAFTESLPKVKEEDAKK